MIDFPSLTPSARKVTQGQYAVKRFTSIAGTGTTRAYGSQPFNAAMELAFENIKDASALEICNCYESARGSYGTLALPSAIWEGCSSNLAQRLTGDYLWRFAEQPQITSVAPGTSSVTVRLEGHRDS